MLRAPVARPNLCQLTQASLPAGVLSSYCTSNMVSSGKHPKRQRDTSLDLPDISHFCSSDLDEVLYPERHQSEATHHQQQQQRHDEILYQNPCDLFDVLPLEIVLEIFKHLDIESLSNAIKTCRRWRYVIQETECLWKWFCFHYYEFPEDVQRDWQEGYSWQSWLGTIAKSTCHNDSVHLQGYCSRLQLSYT
ncbi:F-box only protein 48 [Apostichopus japonicus]|uniref:F-box only protein 48 n=1 Tax=Stichopus japonicus TaxID=307972 RepID=A0A2G8JS27_STIJA|nr:F-box only protein 48 [Apostichopus japonicus]